MPLWRGSQSRVGWHVSCTVGSVRLTVREDGRPLCVLRLDAIEANAADDDRLGTSGALRIGHVRVHDHTTQASRFPTVVRMGERPAVAALALAWAPAPCPASGIGVSVELGPLLVVYAHMLALALRQLVLAVAAAASGPLPYRCTRARAPRAAPVGPLPAVAVHMARLVLTVPLSCTAPTLPQWTIGWRTLAVVVDAATPAHLTVQAKGLGTGWSASSPGRRPPHRDTLDLVRTHQAEGHGRTNHSYSYPQTGLSRMSTWAALHQALLTVRRQLP
jgi:hypothetical protein